jgi:lipopolysaccharide biosynthesis glycosyltransferase
MSHALRVFIGYDPRQPLAYNVVAHSVASRASAPVSITRLQLNQLPITRRGLTEFTYARYLVPWLSDFSGYSLFIDADMLVLGDITQIMKAVDPTAAVSVVMHEAAFERPSLMLFNNKRCQVLTPEFVQDASHSLFDLTWASKVGALPKAWNHVIGYNEPNPHATIVHYTKGIPCWAETNGGEWSQAWHDELQAMVATCSFQDLMGASVHVMKRAG